MTTQDRPLKGAWGITALLFLFMLINFADKVVVGLAGPPLRRDLGLTDQQFGLIGSSFFFLFAVSAIVVGMVTNRVQARHTLLIMAVIWSLVQFPMLGTVSLEVLIACRIVIGAEEAAVRDEDRRALRPDGRVAAHLHAFGLAEREHAARVHGDGVVGIDGDASARGDRDRAARRELRRVGREIEEHQIGRAHV